MKNGKSGFKHSVNVVNYALYPYNLTEKTPQLILIIDQKCHSRKKLLIEVKGVYTFCYSKYLLVCVLFCIILHTKSLISVAIFVNLNYVQIFFFNYL